MKKFIAIIAALTLALSLLVPALAEEVPVINWADVDIESSGIEGSFYTFDQVALQVWIPDVFENVDLTDEDAKNGINGKFMPSDGSAAIVTQYIEGQEGMTLDTLIPGLEASGAKEIERCVLNGLDAVSYIAEDTDAQFVIFVTDAGNIIQFIFTPMSDEGFAQVASLVAASIQPEN